MKKTVLITGCSTGIGFNAATTLKERGYQVFATCRKAEDVEKLKLLGFESFVLDLADSTSIRWAVEEALERSGGRMYALFNNGAYGQPGAVEDLSRKVMRDQFETNLFGTMELTNLIIPSMRANGEGRIVQNSSVLGLISLPYRGAYNASKYALEGLTDAMRLELAPSGILVSIIEPGPITSKFRENAAKAYSEYINRSESFHVANYTRMEKRFSGEDDMWGNLGPEAVTAKLIHALESPRPKIRYYVTIPTYIVAALKRILPHWALDMVIRKQV